VISSVALSDAPYHTYEGITVTVTATGGGTLKYAHVGSNATFSGSSATATLIPTTVGGPFNFAVIVTNGCNTAIKAYSIPTVTRAYRMWLAPVHNGNLGGVAGADAWCMGDDNIPTDVADAKALIAGTDRVACTSASCVTDGADEHTDWPLQANTYYVNASGAQVGLTNELGLFDFSLLHAVGSATHYWSGLSANWTSNAANCTSWSTTAATGAYGNSASLTSAFLYTNTIAGTNSYPIICVEMPVL
jgi:hypothetical protein